MEKREKINNVKIIIQKLLKLNRNDQGKILEKLIKEFGMDIFYCEINDKLYEGDSCQIMGHEHCKKNREKDTSENKEIYTEIKKLRPKHKMRLIERLMMTRYELSIKYCPKCNKLGFGHVFGHQYHENPF